MPSPITLNYHAPAIIWGSATCVFTVFRAILLTCLFASSYYDMEFIGGPTKKSALVGSDMLSITCMVCRDGCVKGAT